MLGVLLIIALPFIGWWLFTSIYDAVFGREKTDKHHYTVNNTYYIDNRSVTIQQKEDLDHLNQ